MTFGTHLKLIIQERKRWIEYLFNQWSQNSTEHSFVTLYKILVRVIIESAIIIWNINTKTMKDKTGAIGNNIQQIQF